MQNILTTIILGIVQGLTEWLPVSSSGHLIIFQNLLKTSVSLTFNIALHLGTILASLIYFKKDITKILKDFFTLNFKTNEGKTSLYIILALIPTAIIGYFLNKFTNNFSSLLIIGISLLITGTLLYIASMYEPKGNLNPKNTFLCGIFQGLAVIPGFSRSGFTISSLIFSGVEREQAARFSFILAIPTILGASLLKIKEIATINPSELFTGIAVSAIIGYLAIGLMMNLLLHKRFKLFAYWCWVIGVIVLISVI